MHIFKLLIIFNFLIVSPANFAAEILRLGTTTSTEDSGLLKFLLPEFEATNKMRVHVISTGTGKALKLGENGDVDVLLVHSRPDEEKFIADGYGIGRRDVMYNDFVIVGPSNDPAKIRGMTDAVAALKKILATKSLFVSRGDQSGTHKMEQRLWDMAGLQPAGDWYFSIGQGMGETLNMASSKQAYTLSDRGTYIAYKQRATLDVLVTGDPRIYNSYGVMAVNPKRYSSINYAGAQKFIDWITSPDCQQRIASFRAHGEQLFFPNAGIASVQKK
ncbi:MAG: substrate-binding domain-containing protein [Burkholderiales bacterium]